jgi:phosphate-selective porin OprO/OprP
MQFARSSHGIGRNQRLQFAAFAAMTISMAMNAPAAGASEAELQQLLQQQARRLDEQDARLRALEEQLAARPPPPPTDIGLQGIPVGPPEVKANKHTFAIGDQENELRFHAILNVDGRYFRDANPPPGVDTWLLRQARPIFEGTVSRMFDFNFTPDFAGGKTIIQDAFITARFNPGFQLTAGKFKVPFGLERLQYETDTRFIERGLPNNLVPNRDLGVQVAGDVLTGRLEYALAAQNGVSDGGSSDAIGDVDNNNEQEFTARLFAHPFDTSADGFWKGFGVGIAGNYSNSTGAAGRTLLPSYFSPGQRLVFAYRAGATPTIQNGERVRVSPQFYFYRGPLGVLGEFVQVDQAVARTLGASTREARVRQRAWQLQAGWYLTGESAAYQVVTPAASFGPGAGFGAVELVARVGVLDLDAGAFTGGASAFADPTVSIRRATAVAAGVNWHLTPAVRAALNYELTRFRGGEASATDRPDEKALFSRFQVGF